MNASTHAVYAVFLRCFTCHPAAFLTIWGGQPKAQPSFFNIKGQPSLLIIVGLTAALRVLCRKCRQPLFEIGVVGLDFNDEKSRIVPMLPNFFEIF